MNGEPRNPSRENFGTHSALEDLRMANDSSIVNETESSEEIFFSQRLKSGSPLSTESSARHMSPSVFSKESEWDRRTTQHSGTDSEATDRIRFCFIKMPLKYKSILIACFVPFCSFVLVVVLYFATMNRIELAVDSTMSESLSGFPTDPSSSSPRIDTNVNVASGENENSFTPSFPEQEDGENDESDLASPLETSLDISHGQKKEGNKRIDSIDTSYKRKTPLPLPMTRTLLRRRKMFRQRKQPIGHI